MRNYAMGRLGAGLIASIMGCLSFIGSANAQGTNWPSAGFDIENTRHQKNESKVDIANVAGLQTKWFVNTGGEVSATPAVDGDYVYFPDFAGNFYKVGRDSGNIIWQRQISDYVGQPGIFARTTPAIHGDLLIFGDQGGRVFAGAHMMAIDKNTGDLVWLTAMDAHPAAIITTSATVHGNTVFVGVASFEEFFAAVIPGYPCCSFRGSMAALNADTGEVIWQTYTTAAGFSGNAIWGSSPSVDVKRGQVYAATGNNYSAPQSFLDCVSIAGSDMNAQRDCLDPYPDNYFDAVMAFDMKTGAVNWTNVVIPFDVWTVACLFVLPTCPSPQGPDFDFGQAPILYTVGKGSGKRDLVGVGQKSGVFWSIDADNGETVWSTQVSPGGVAGGMIWGSAFDGDRIYTSSANSESKPWQLIDSSMTTAGIWSALNPATGEIVWQTANPTGFGAGGAVTSANGVVYACSLDPVGNMYALDAASGSVEWGFASGGSCNAGAAITNGQLFWGSGYTALGPPGTFNNQLYSFELP